MKLFVAVFFSLLFVIARADIPTVALKAICLSQLDAPVAIANAGDGSGRLFVCEQRGKIRVIQNGMLLPQPFLDLTARLVPERAAYDERGLLGLAFHPGFATPASPGFRKFYVFYSAPSPNAPGTATDPVDCRTVIAEYQVATAGASVADPVSERILLAFDKPQFNHNGGQLDFGPDNFLYLSTGDGGAANDNNAGHTGGSSSQPAGVLGNAQDTTRLHGKILRIDPVGNNAPGGQYGIPADNPFVGVGGGVREEIYAFGLRNPWRFSFDPANGRLFCADVGQDRVEEVDLITKGGNFGWRVKEGNFDSDPTAPNGGLPLLGPIAQYQHPGINPSLGLPAIGISVTGGYVYRGSAFPALVGKYVFGDYSNSFGAAAGTLLGLEETTPNNWSFSKLTVIGGNPIPTRILAFGRDEAGEIYLATKVNLAPSQPDPNTGLPAGGIYKIVAPATVTTTLEPLKDNTMFQENTNNSDGQGYLYAGRTQASAGNSLRRALLAFNLSGVLPAGAVPTSATLSLTVNKTTTGPINFTLNKLTQDWGEGPSFAIPPGGSGVPAENNDATWANRFYNKTTPASSTPWTIAGGTFANTVSATTAVGFNGVYSWTGAGMLDDVQAWLGNPATNFGWILRGNEISGANAKRFFSGEDTTPANRPHLVIGYPGEPPLTRREEWLQQYFFVGQFVDDAADLDGDSLPNLLEYAYAFSPLARNSPSSGLAIAVTSAGPNTTFTTAFRRDPRATDLTYRLQTSDDLITWTTIVESAGGADPTGAGFSFESDVPGESPVKLVTAVETLSGTRHFARLEVVRAP